MTLKPIENQSTLENAFREYILDEGLSKTTNSPINIYQIFTRLFGNKIQKNIAYGSIEENGVGKFNDINENAIIALKELGITHIWYTGIIEHAVLTDYSNYGIAVDYSEIVKGRAGSPYAIKDYYDVNPDLAVNVNDRMQEFEGLVERTHAQGLKVIIDFVPNHVARCYHSDSKPVGVEDFGEKDDTTLAFHPQNNFYYMPGVKLHVPKASHPYQNPTSGYYENPAKATGNNQFTHQPGVDDWYETVKLNYGVDFSTHQKFFDPIPSTWKKMLDILKYWAEKKIDGFRCDMAEMVPVEFWEWAIAELKKTHPHIIFIAEIYNPDQYHSYIHQGGFDYLYDKVQLYDTLRNLVKGEGKTEYLTGIWKFLRGINRHMLRFLENHDEQRIASPEFAGDPLKALPALVISATLYNGPLMIYFGQEVGEPGSGESGFSGNDGRTTIFDYWGVPEHQKWMNGGKFDGALLDEKQVLLRNLHKKLLNLRLDESTLSDGKFFDLHSFNLSRPGNHDKSYSFLRYSDKHVLLIVANFNPHSYKAFVPIPEKLRCMLNLKEGNLKALVLFPEENFPVEVEKDTEGTFMITVELTEFSASIIKLNIYR